MYLSVAPLPVMGNRFSSGISSAIAVQLMVPEIVWEDFP